MFLSHELTHTVIAHIFIKMKTVLREYVINMCTEKTTKLNFKMHSSS